MNLEEIKQIEFLLSLGYVTLISSVLTLLTMQICKIILKHRKIVTVQSDKTQKDYILSRLGRVVALVIYCSVYLANEYYLKKAIVFDETLIIGLCTGSATTATLAKGIYTSFRQKQKRDALLKYLETMQEEFESLPTKSIKYIDEFQSKNHTGGK